MSIRMVIVAAIALAILAFNPHIIGGVRDQADNMISTWSKSNKTGKPIKTPLTVKPPKFPERDKRRMKAEPFATDTSDLHGSRGKQTKGNRPSSRPSASDTGFGARAVAVQRAKNL